jgi:hypothetical protein
MQTNPTPKSHVDEGPNQPVQTPGLRDSKYEIHCMGEVTLYHLSVATFKTMKSRRMRWAGQVARMGEKRKV